MNLTVSDWDGLIAQADRALYKAKENGRNQIIYVGDLPAEEETQSADEPVLLRPI